MKNARTISVLVAAWIGCSVTTVWAQSNDSDSSRRLRSRGFLGGGMNTGGSVWLFGGMQVASENWYANLDLALVETRVDGVRYTDGRSGKGVEWLYNFGISTGREWSKERNIAHLGVGGGVSIYAHAYQMQESDPEITPDVAIHRYYNLPYLQLSGDYQWKLGSGYALGVIGSTIWTPKVSVLCAGVILTVGPTGSGK